jgi:hypothetical protein
MRDRAIGVAKAAVGGFVLVFLMGITVVLVVSVVGLVVGASAIDLGIGPVPLMMFRNGSAGYSFQSEWGIGALAYVGAAGSAGVALRRQLMERTTAASGGSSTPS